MLVVYNRYVFLACRTCRL